MTAEAQALDWFAARVAERGFCSKVEARRAAARFGNHPEEAARIEARLIALCE